MPQSTQSASTSRSASRNATTTNHSPPLTLGRYPEHNRSKQLRPHSTSELHNVRSPPSRSSPRPCAEWFCEGQFQISLAFACPAPASSSSGQRNMRRPSATSQRTLDLLSCSSSPCQQHRTSSHTRSPQAHPPRWSGTPAPLGVTLSCLCSILSIASELLQTNVGNATDTRNVSRCSRFDIAISNNKSDQFL